MSKTMGTAGKGMRQASRSAASGIKMAARAVSSRQIEDTDDSGGFLAASHDDRSLLFVGGQGEGEGWGGKHEVFLLGIQLIKGTMFDGKIQHKRDVRTELSPFESSTPTQTVNPLGRSGGRGEAGKGR